MLPHLLLIPWVSIKIDILLPSVRSILRVLSLTLLLYFLSTYFGSYNEFFQVSSVAEHMFDFNIRKYFWKARITHLSSFFCSENQVDFLFEWHKATGNTQLTLLSSWKHCKYNKKHKTRAFLWHNIVWTRIKQPT